MLTNNFVAFIITLILAIFWIRLNDFFAAKGWITSKLSRKIVHIGTGPIYVACWLLFPHTSNSRYFAAIIPLVITMQFFLVGIGIIKDEATVKALSRSGDRKEILYGPLIYGLVFVLITIIYWYDNPIGIIALMCLAGGDGFADIVGRHLKSTKLPWSPQKSWAGMIGMFFSSWLFSTLMSLLFIAFQVFDPPLNAYLLPITIISFISTTVESLQLQKIDNLTVTIAALLVGHILF